MRPNLQSLEITLDDIPAEVMVQIWARRAAQLAQVPPREEEGEQIEMLFIRLGCEAYGFDVQYVFDIRPAELITRVPRVPGWVAGVTNLRGRILSVLDLQRFLGLPHPSPQKSRGVDREEQLPAGESRSRPHGGSKEKDGGNGYLVVVETPQMELALLVDEVLAVELMPVSRIQETIDTIRGLRPDHVRGISEWQGSDGGDGLLVVLDLPALLADERLAVHEEIV